LEEFKAHWAKLSGHLDKFRQAKARRDANSKDLPSKTELSLKGFHFISLPESPFSIKKAIKKANKKLGQIQKHNKGGAMTHKQTADVLKQTFGFLAKPNAKQGDIASDVQLAIKVVVEVLGGGEKVTAKSYREIVKQIQELQLRFCENMAREAAQIDMQEAQRVFAEADQDQSGFLVQAEMGDFTQWLFMQMRPGGAALSMSESRREGATVMSTIDVNGDGKIYWDEIVWYFEAKAQQLSRFQVAQGRFQQQHEADMDHDAGHTEQQRQKRQERIIATEEAMSFQEVASQSRAAAKKDHAESAKAKAHYEKCLANEESLKREGQELEQELMHLRQAAANEEDAYKKKEFQDSAARLKVKKEEKIRGLPRLESITEQAKRDWLRLQGIADSSKKDVAAAELEASRRELSKNKAAKAHGEDTQLRSFSTEVEGNPYAYARKRFNELDDDANGALEGNELELLVKLVLETMSKTGATAEDLAQDHRTIMSMIPDACRVSGRMSFPEFEALMLKIEYTQLSHARNLSQEASKLDFDFARQRFDELDTDGSGFIEGSELPDFTMWAISTLRPGGKQLGEQQLLVVTELILAELDIDCDKKVSFQEFENLFKNKAAMLPHLEAKLKGKKLEINELETRDNEAERIGREAYSLPDDVERMSKIVLSEARIKFNELDVSNDEVLDGNEIAQLAVFVLEKVARDGATSEDIKMDARSMMESIHSKTVSWPEFETLYKDLEKQHVKSKAIMSAAVSKLDKNIAKDKFESLDVDKSGFLQGEELCRFVDWLYHDMVPGGKKLRKREMQVHADKLLAILDKDSDGKVSYAEFQDWFDHQEKSRGVFEASFRDLHEEARANQTQKAEAHGQDLVSLEIPIPHQDRIEDTLAAARAKFLELDEDGNNELRAGQVTELCQFVINDLSHSRASTDAIQTDVTTLAGLMPGDKVKYHDFEVAFDKCIKHKVQYEVHMALEAAKVSSHEMGEAKRKFDEFDKDKSGKLEGEEINAFGDWVFSGMKPHGKKLEPAEIKAETRKLRESVDLDGDSYISFEEFEQFFEQKAKCVDEMCHRLEQSQLKEDKFIDDKEGADRRLEKSREKKVSREKELNTISQDRKERTQEGGQGQNEEMVIVATTIDSLPAIPNSAENGGSERPKVHKDRRKEAFDQLDADNSGKLSGDELKTLFKIVLGELADDDGGKNPVKNDVLEKDAQAIKDCPL